MATLCPLSDSNYKPWFEGLSQISGFVHAQDQVVDSAPPHLLSVGQVVVILDKAHHCCVICKLYKMVGDSSGDTIVCHLGEHQRAQDTALKGPCPGSDDTEGDLSSPH